MKRIICYSGGHSSAIVAIEVARKYPDDEIILLNHDINPNVEGADIKRFKREVAEYLNLPITYVNYEGIQNCEELPDQFDVSIKIKGFKFGNGTELCTYNLKTKPFYAWLKENCNKENTVIYYGFDANEMHRVQRRSSILAKDGWKTDFPIALWKKEDRTITQTMQIGIARPMQYDTFKHANCFSADTKFITDQGVYSLVEKVGQKVNVITRAGWRSAEIKAFGQQELYEVTLVNANRTSVVRAPADHRWIMPKHNHKSFGYQEKSTSDLKEGDLIPSVYSLPNLTPDRKGIQHGFTFGDGSIYRTSSFKEGKFKSRAYIAAGKEAIIPYFDNHCSASKNIHSLPASFKELPDTSESKEYLLGFLVGLIASDGCVSKSGITISNKSKEVILSVEQIARTLGLFAWFQKTTVRDTNYKKGAKLSHMVISRKSFKREWLIKETHIERYGERFTEPKSWKIHSVKKLDVVEPVYCAVVDGDFKEFALDGNILTGNCIGCLKAGKQHWYVVYCVRRDLWEKAKRTEEALDHSIIKGVYLDELEEQFEQMRQAGVPANEHINANTFWSQVKKSNLDGFAFFDYEEEANTKPCECVF